MDTDQSQQSLHQCISPGTVLDVPREEERVNRVLCAWRGRALSLSGLRAVNTY